MEGNESGLFPTIMPRCEEPIEDLRLSCVTDVGSGGTPQNPDWYLQLGFPEWDEMNNTELYVRASEENVTMMFNVTQGMPIDFNITVNGSIETELRRDIGSGKMTCDYKYMPFIHLDRYLIECTFDYRITSIFQMS